MSSSHNLQSDKQQKKKRNWALTIRSLHFYASMFVAVMILFYAVTGFLATHLEWFVGEQHHHDQADIRSIPVGLIEDKERLQQWCREIVAVDADVEKTENEDEELWYLVRGKERAVQCIIDQEALEVEVIALSVLNAPGLDSNRAIADFIANDLGGHLNVESIYEDEDYQTLSFSVESVWFESHVSLFKNKNVYNIDAEATPFIQSLVHLHRGKHSNIFQTFLADVTAIMLTFVVITGLVIGIQMKKKRTMSYIALAVSVILTLLLIIAR